MLKSVDYVMKKWKKILGFRHSIAIFKHNYLQKKRPVNKSLTL